MLVKVANKDTESVITALIKSAHKLPLELYKSLTWDRGKELADHPRFTLATDVDVYFCDPQSLSRQHVSHAPAGQCVATRIKREHQPAFEAVFASRNRPIRPFTSQTQRNCKAIQRTTSQDIAISNPRREVRRVCCIDRLRSPSKAAVDAMQLTSAPSSCDDWTQTFTKLSGEKHRTVKPQRDFSKLPIRLWPLRQLQQTDEVVIEWGCQEPPCR